MIETETKEVPLKDRAFSHLATAIKRVGQPAHLAIASHIRAITDGKHNNLGVYHNDPSITDESKLATYKRCFNALIRKGGPDYDALTIVKAGHPDGEVIEIPQKRATKPVEASELTEVVETAKPADPLTKAILDVVRPYLESLRGNAKLDENRVNELANQVAREVVGEELEHDRFSANVRKVLENGALPIERITAMIDGTLSKAMENQVQRIMLCKVDGTVKELKDRQHYRFPLLVAALSQRLNVALVGPAGSSKTTAAHMASKALELPFEAISVGPMTSKADLLGFMDANGKYHDTATVRRATEGGIMLWDEFDAANASVATYGNMLLANEHFGTPVGMKAKHKDFCMVAGLNTYGLGANRVYVGRNQLDGATLDRFVVIDWDYDEGLEGSIVGVEHPSPKLNMAEGGILEPKEWMDYVVKVRRACEKLAIRHVVSPRATIHGVKLFLAGVGRSHVERMVLFKGLEAASVNKIKEAM